MSHQSISKSTKRRKYLEEIEIVDFMLDNQELQSVTQLATSQFSVSNLVVKNQNLHSSSDSGGTIKDNFSDCYNTKTLGLPSSNIDFSDNIENGSENLQFRF